MSGLIPQACIDEVLHRINIVELIDGYVPLKKRGLNYTACCPFHNEKTPSFNVNEKKQFYHCFGCGASGNAISFIISYLNQGFVAAVETLAARAGVSIPRDGKSQHTDKTVSLYKLLEEVCTFYQKNLKQSAKAIHYLQQRGVSGEIAKRFQLGFALPDWNNLENQFSKNTDELITTGMLIKKDNHQTYDRYRQRLMFPIHDRLGRIIGFGGRSIDAAQNPKYLNSPETIIFQKNRELYGLHQILQQEKTPDSIIIVEGYLDVIALAQHGINNAVAALGTATSTYHIQLLSKHCKVLYFCFDGDAAGRKAGWRALEHCLPHLENGLDPHFVFLPEGNDPDSLIRQESPTDFLSRINKATKLSDYFFETITKNIDLQSAAGKSQLITSAKPFFQLIPLGADRELILDELSRLTRIENHRLLQLLQTAETDSASTLQTITRSPVRQAVALLLQHPELYTNCAEKISIASLDGEGQEVLQQLLQQVASNPTANTAALIENWRDNEMFPFLSKLASWEHLVPESALSSEFIEIINFLQKQNLESKINLYLTKSRKIGLTLVEQKQLQDLVIRRHHSIADKN